MAVHKHCYTSLNRTNKAAAAGGLRCLERSGSMIRITAPRHAVRDLPWEEADDCGFKVRTTATSICLKRRDLSGAIRFGSANLWERSTITAAIRVRGR